MDPGTRWSLYGQRNVAHRRIAGRVSFEGKPFVGARVSLRWIGMEAEVAVPPAVVSDASGRFDLGAWFAERFAVTAAAEGKTAAVAEVDLRDPVAVPPPDQLELALTRCEHMRVGTVVDGSGGDPAWDYDVAPSTDAQGQVVLDPAPAGRSAVYCDNPAAGMSAARAFVTLGRGERATAQLVTVHLQPPGAGDIGIELDQGFPLTVSSVRDDGPAAVAGIRAGDAIVALDGRAIGQLAKGGVLHWILSQPIGRDRHHRAARRGDPDAARDRRALAGAAVTCARARGAVPRGDGYTGCIRRAACRTTASNPSQHMLRVRPGSGA